ncbi:retrovirus-related pol polyprotein from transposon TNT 1-94 [Tanacetum coccineum]
MIGELMYLTTSRPDIAFTTFVCAHWETPQRDLAGCLDDYKSTSGGLQFLGDKLVSWSSKKPDCTTMSTAEAEYVSLSACYAQVIWKRTQLLDYEYRYNKIPMYYDSKSAIAISCNPVQHSRTKHINIRYHFIKEHVKRGTIKLYFVGMEYQLTGLFTKALPRERFEYLVHRIEDYHSIKDDIPLVSVYTMGNVFVRGMLILNEFLTEEIRATDDYKEYDSVFIEVDVPINQPQPVVSTQGTHRTIPRAHSLPTFTTATPQGKKSKQFAGESKPGSHKEHPKEVSNNDEKKEEEKDKKKDDEMGNKNIDQELTDIISPLTATTSQDPHKQRRISNSYRKVDQVLHEIVPQIAERSTNDLIESNLKPMVANTIMEDHDAFQAEVPALISNEFNTQAPKIIEELFKQYVLNNMKRSLQDRANDIALWEELDAWVEETIIDEDEVILEDETPELITKLQNVDKHIPTIFDCARMEATLNDVLSNQFRNAEEYAYHLEQATNFLKNQIVHKEFNNFNEDTRLSIQHWKDSWRKRVYKQNQRKVRDNPKDYFSNHRITEAVRIITDQLYGLDFMEQILVMRENDKPNSFSKADFKYLNKTILKTCIISARTRSKNEKRVMYLVEIVKFCDATLEKVLKEVKLRIFQTELWKKPPLIGELDLNIIKAHKREITKRLRHREQMRRNASLSLDELIENLKVHEMIIKKDSEIVKAKGERKYLALKAKKESSDEECLTFGSEDEEYAMVTFQRSLDDKNGKNDRKCFRCSDPNHLIRECPKPPKDKNQRAFVGGSWSDIGEEDDEKAKDEMCLVAQALNEICLGVDLEPDEWIKDSGCSKHMTGNQKLFSTYKAYSGGNVIFGSNLRCNIIGKGQICDNKCRVIFSEHDSEITKDGMVIGRGYSQNSKAYIVLTTHSTKIKESLNVTFDETPPPSKTSPLVDDDLDEEEAIIKITEKRNLENDIEDETLEIGEILNTKESKNHPLENVIGNINQRTLRLVAQGYNQQEDIDYDETYAPVARLKSIRILLAYSCALDFKLFQMDV